MNEDFYNNIQAELASEIGQKAVIIATLQTRVKNYHEYTQKLEEENKRLQEAKNELQADFEALQKEKEELQNQLNELKVEGAE
uniref:Cell division protein n=2 Tax=unclassified Caudoviricetes TaxID=2788787 RepID=A0A8S5QKD5_9CAUD|nr:MAG TPA: cell division protein [Siphoviridae sp. ct58g5]DAF88700.1 MAG TPA: cell division protein [Siphoviridae sp. ctxD432]